jgi:hypothetical protein
MDDRIESLFGVAFAVSAAASIGIGTVEFGGYQMLETITTVGPMTLDYATVISVAALVVAYLELGGGATDLGNLPDLQLYAVYLAAGLTVWGSFDPGFAADQNLAIQLALVGGTLVGYWALAHED